MGQQLGRWEPLDVRAVAGLLSTAAVQWWIAGGWAIDLHLGRQTRPHGDIDVLGLRPDLHKIRSCIKGWDLHAADPPGILRPWRPGEVLPPRVHDVWGAR